jgi:hypothetical protein
MPESAAVARPPAGGARAALAALLAPGPALLALGDRVRAFARHRGLAAEELPAEEAETEAAYLEGLLAEAVERERRSRSSGLELPRPGADEAGVLATVLADALADLGESVEPGTPVPRLLVLLVRRYQAELDRLRADVQTGRDRHLAILDALAAAARGREPDGLALGGDAEVVLGVAALLRHAAGRDRELAEARRRLAQQESQPAAAARSLTLPGEDERLALYRQAAAAWERGEDPGPMLSRIRAIERVFALETPVLTAAMRDLDLGLDALVKVLVELRKCTPLTEDPRRFRLRLLKSSPYDLKRLDGVLAAIRDAGRDLLAYVQAAHDAATRTVVIDGLEELRPALVELVKLVAAARSHAGGGPALSVSIDLGAAGGLAGLPRSLAADLDALLAGKAGKALAGGILPLVEECGGLLRGVLERAGLAVGEAPAGGKAAPPTRLKRWAEHLDDLARAQDAALGDLVASSRSEAERRLLAETGLLLRGLREIDALAQRCAALPGAPALTVPTLPQHDAEAAALRSALVPRLDHLAEVARYRVL